MELNEDVRAMYDGYSFSGVDLYNPCSILNYVQCRNLEPYWVNTSENKLVRSTVENEVEPGYYQVRIPNKEVRSAFIGLCVFLSGDYIISSNRAWGYGRSDILLCSKKESHPHIVMGAKYTKEASCDLKQLAEEAVVQIEEKHYMAGLKGSILFVGVGHRGKSVEAAWKMKS